MIRNRRRRTVRGALAAAAVTVAMAATAGTSFASGDPAGAATRARAAAGAEQQQAGKAQGAASTARATGAVETPSFPMLGVNKTTTDLYMYWTDDQGGFQPREYVTSGFDAFADSIDADNDKDGWSDHTWHVYKDGKLTYSWIDDDDLEYHSNQVGKGWNIYPTILSPAASAEPRRPTSSAWTRPACCGATSATRTAASPRACGSAVAGASTPSSPARET